MIPGADPVSSQGAAQGPGSLGRGSEAPTMGGMDEKVQRKRREGGRGDTHDTQEV